MKCLIETILSDNFIARLSPACQFHQHFTHAFFVQNFGAKNYKDVLGLKFLAPKKFVQKMCADSVDEIDSLLPIRDFSSVKFPFKFLFSLKHTDTHMHALTHAHTRTHALTRTHAHTHSHAHTRTNKHVRRRFVHYALFYGARNPTFHPKWFGPDFLILWFDCDILRLCV